MPVETNEKDKKKSQFSFIKANQDQDMSDSSGSLSNKSDEKVKETTCTKMVKQKSDKSVERFCGNIKDGDDDYDDEIEQSKSISCAVESPFFSSKKESPKFDKNK